MEKSQLRLVLRACLLALFVLIVLLVGLSFVSDKLLPEELAEWNRHNNGGELKVTDILGLLFWGAGLVLLFIGMAGLFFYQRWAAWMLLFVTLLFSLQVLTSPVVDPGLLAYLGGWADTLTGLIFGLAFFTDVLSSEKL